MNLTIYKKDNLPIKTIDGMSYIYVIGVENKVKVGLTTTPKQRFNTIINAGGYKNATIAISAQMQSFDVIDFEIMIHNYLQKYRIQGEWFSLDFDNVLIIINNLKKEDGITKIKKNGIALLVTQNDKYLLISNVIDIAIKYFNIKPSELKDKTYGIFKKRRSIKLFMQVLAESESLEVDALEQGRGKTKRIHPVLAIRYCSWLSPKFEVFIYHFFLENYPSLRESGGDYYNELRMVWLPKLFIEANLVGIVIQMNVYFKQKLKRTTDWNTATKNDYCIRNHVFNNIITDIKLGEKPLSREVPINFLKRKIDYHMNRYLTMIEIDEKIFGSNQSVHVGA